MIEECTGVVECRRPNQKGWPCVSLKIVIKSMTGDRRRCVTWKRQQGRSWHVCSCATGLAAEFLSVQTGKKDINPSSHRHFSSKCHYLSTQNTEQSGVWTCCFAVLRSQFPPVDRWREDRIKNVWSDHTSQVARSDIQKFRGLQHPRAGPGSRASISYGLASDLQYVRNWLFQNILWTLLCCFGF